jgi:predicted nucleic acid-binding protein
MKGRVGPWLVSWALSLTGVLGVLLRAKRTGKLKAVKPEIDASRKEARFFIAPALESVVLAKAGE